MKRFLLLVILLRAVPAAAQLPSAVQVETALHYGFVWKHTPKLTIRTGAPLWGQEFSLLLQTRGARPWHSWRKFPLFSLTFGRFELGEAAHGTAWTCTPGLNLPLLHRERLGAYFRVGTGLARVSRPYNYFDNPDQNALGSHWNNSTQFRFYAVWRPDPHWRVLLGGGLSHLSNGGMSLPNFGVNIPTLFAGANWSPQALRRADFYRWPDQPKRGGRGFGAQAQAGLALVEYSQYDGPRYPIWNVSGAVFYHINRANRFHLGLDYELNKAIYQWGIYANVFKSDAEAQQGATRVAVYLADEFMFGNWGIHLQAGNYVGQGINQYVLRRRYAKVSTRYYLPPLLGKGPRPYCGVTLKAHAAIAESIMLHLGFSSR